MLLLSATKVLTNPLSAAKKSEQKGAKEVAKMPPKKNRSVHAGSATKHVPARQVSNARHASSGTIKVASPG